MPLWEDVLYGWKYILDKPGLDALLLFFAITNFTLGIVQVLITPLALTIASPQDVGLVLAFGGTGMLVGGIMMAVWRRPKRRVLGLIGFILLQGTLLLLAGFPTTLPLIAGATFAFLFCFPVIVTCSQVIWQTKVPPSIQGRVFAVRRTIAMGTLPLAFLVAGPLADYVFEPLLTANGPLAGSIGKIIGVGPGRGIGLLFMLMGVQTILAVIAGYLYPRLRLLEDEIPDVIVEDSVAAGLTSNHAF